MSNTFFQGGAKNFLGGDSPPCTPWLWGWLSALWKTSWATQVFQMFMFSLQKKIWRRDYN